MKLYLSPAERKIFLRTSREVEEGSPSLVTKSIGLLLSFFTILFIFWTVFAELEESISAPGEIVPIGFVQAVQHHDKGIVSEILVQEGSIVQEGDIVLRFDGQELKDELSKETRLLEVYEKRVQTAKELFDVQERLKQSGVASEARYIVAKQAYYDAIGQVEIEKELISRLKKKIERLEVRAPVSGTVKGLKINTIGAVVRPAEAVMEIVPSDRPLVVEAFIKPEDIGEIHEGQNVFLRISAFDFARYGALEGTLDLITATTFIDDKGNRFYRARISLKQDYLFKNGKKVKILPGMLVEASIITGEKSIFSYLFKPIQRALASSLREQ